MPAAITLPTRELRSALLRYTVAVAAVGVSVAMGIWLEPYTYTTPFLTFYAACLLVAWFGGFRPGLLATVLAALSANYFFLLPHPHQFNFDIPSVVQTLFFVATFATVSWLAEQARTRLYSTIDVQSQLLEMSFDPVIVRDAEDRIIFWNRGAERLYGFKKDEAYGRVTHDLLRTVHPKPLDEIRAELNKNGRWHGELVHSRKDGSTVVVASWWTLQKENNRQSAILESNYDLTERKRAEESLRYLSAIVESSDAAIIGKTLDGIVTAWNHSAESLYGYTAAEMIGQPISRLNPEGHVNEFPTILKRLGKGEYVEAYDTVRRHKDGTVIDVSLKVSPIFNAAGKIIGASSIARDIRERKRAEEALRRSEQQFRTLADSIPQLAWMANPDGWIFWHNRRWYEYTGTTPEMMEGWGWQSVHDPAALPKVMERWQNCLQTGNPFDMVYPLRGADGVFRPFLSRAIPLRDAAGKIVRWFGTNTDISAQKQAEEALIKQEKLASVGRMAATIAHEINNPLAAAMNALYLVCANAGLPESARPSLELAEHELERVAHITKQTLGFYREAGSATAVRLPEVIDGVLSLFGPKLKSRTLRVERNYAEGGAEAFGVEGEIRQIISNLVANSIDSMAANGTLHVRTCGPVCLNGQRPMVRLTIADTGSGISPESAPRIFEPFFTTKAAIGTGLGLWVTKELVTKHEGTIRMRSQVGKGTVFTVWLPSERRHAERLGSAGAA